MHSIQFSSLELLREKIKNALEISGKIQRIYFLKNVATLLIYINNLCDNLNCDVKLFADDTSLFALVFNENTSAQNLNNDLRKIQE